MSPSFALGSDNNYKINRTLNEADFKVSRRREDADGQDYTAHHSCTPAHSPGDPLLF